MYLHTIFKLFYNLLRELIIIDLVHHYPLPSFPGQGGQGKEVKLKISHTLKGRVVSEEVKANHIAGARKKPVYCYDFETGKYLMEFSGLRIMARALNLNNAHFIRRRLDKNIPLNVTIDGADYKLLLKSKPIP
uniref:GIY-YIG homing endonuclease n=1 Tax=Pappia fissilis TaxID=1040649 RepID=UPI002A8157B1|nr:GIY-YIG homing endonuclease [Pappia fissilis]WOX61260.1 GIY-YIG homing endonuclease [Pappia fissilis]